MILNIEFFKKNIKISLLFYIYNKIFLFIKYNTKKYKIK